MTFGVFLFSSLVNLTHIVSTQGQGASRRWISQTSYWKPVSHPSAPPPHTIHPSSPLMIYPTYQPGLSSCMSLGSDPLTCQHKCKRDLFEAGRYVSACIPQRKECHHKSLPSLCPNTIIPQPLPSPDSRVLPLLLPCFSNLNDLTQLSLCNPTHTHYSTYVCCCCRCCW